MKKLIISLICAMSATGIASNDPGLCPESSECEQNRIDIAAENSEARALQRARQAHPGHQLGRVSVECSAESHPSGAGMISCRVGIELPWLATDFDCDIGWNDSGLQYLECRTL